MVAARKKPSAPAPPTSRTNSSQALPRTVSTKSLSKSSDGHLSSPLSSSQAAPNGIPSTHTTHSQQSKTPLARPKKRSLVDRILFLFLATFASYALYTCPSDSSYDSSVCRSLATYRTRVLEPYVIPPIHAALTHPSVVQPYEHYAKPVYQNYVQPVTPYLAAAQRQTAPYVNTVVRVSKRLTSSVWDTLLVPYWTRAVMPRYTIYLQPHVNKYVSPLIRRARYYNRQAEPYIQSFAHHTSIYAHQAQKYVLLAYDRLQPYVARVYSFTKPHVLRGYARIKPSLLKLAQATQSKGKYVASRVLGRVGALRREFVDPHVLRIWEKAVEKSGPSSTEIESAPTTPTTTFVSAQTELPTSFEAIPSVEAHSEPATVEAAPQPTADTESRTVESIPLSSTISVHVSEAKEELVTSDAPKSEGVVPPPEATATLEKAASIAEASAAHASNVIAKMESEITEAEERLVAEQTSDPIRSPAPATVESTPDEHLHEAPQATPHAESEDLDDFLREIGLDEEEKVLEPESEPESITPPVDPEAKKEAVAAKRANIVGRHVRWQAELDSLVKNLEVRVKEDIAAVRRDAIAHIGKLPYEGQSSAADGKGKEVVDKVQSEGAKLLKGLEAYVKKVTSHALLQEDLEKEKEKWKKIVDKVEGKYKDIVRDIQADVHGWYVQIKDKEISVVLVAASEVKALADRAQADLGLDYAWLDDVTYYDWQNYHDLMRTYERFDQTARALQNGTHTEAPEDSLVPVLNQLDREVQRAIAGFAMQMNHLEKEGEQWLNSVLEVPSSDEAEVEFEDEECEEYEDEEEEPEFSILPIPPQPSADQVDPASVLIGKSAEQVEKLAEQAVADHRIEL